MIDRSWEERYDYIKVEISKIHRFKGKIHWKDTIVQRIRENAH